MLQPLFNRAYKKTLSSRLDGDDSMPLPPGGRTEKRFVSAMFMLMGRVAKLDGLVTEAEVKFASDTMNLIGLGYEKRQRAIGYFDTGKNPNIDVMEFVKALQKDIGSRSMLAEDFVKILCQFTYTKGDMRLKEKMLLRDVAEELGFNKAEFLEICGEVLNRSESYLRERPRSLRSAYQVLQLQPRVADGEIRKAYLRLIAKYHPDKLVRENLSQESIKHAEEKFLAIRSAYETVCGFRKLRV